MRADRSPNPALFEVRYQYQQVWFELEGHTIRMRNDYRFTDLNNFALEISMEAEGEQLYSRRVTVECPPDGTATCELLPMEYPAGKEIVCNLRLATLKDTAYAPAGHVVAYEQFVMQQIGRAHV